MWKCPIKRHSLSESVSLMAEGGVAPLIPAPGGGCCVCQRRRRSEEGSSEASPSHPSGPGGGQQQGVVFVLRTMNASQLASEKHQTEAHSVLIWSSNWGGCRSVCPSTVDLCGLSQGDHIDPPCTETLSSAGVYTLQLNCICIFICVEIQRVQVHILFILHRSCWEHNTDICY